MKLIMYTFLGLFPGILTHLLIHAYEKKDTTLGTFTLPRCILLYVCSILGTIFGVIGTGGKAYALAAILFNMAMLLFASYTDLRSGQVYVLYVYLDLFIQIVLFVMALRTKGSDIYIHGVEIVTLFVMLSALYAVGLAKIDVIIFVSCILTLYQIGGPFAIGFIFIMIFIANSMPLIVLRKRFRTKEGRQNRFPFTAYIALGCIVAYALTALLSGWY